MMTRYVQIIKHTLIDFKITIVVNSRLCDFEHFLMHLITDLGNCKPLVEVHNNVFLWEGPKVILRRRKVCLAAKATH